MDYKDNVPSRGGNMDHKDGAPTGGVGIWVWSMVAGWKDQTRKIQIKGRDRNGKNRNERPKQSGGVGAGAESGAVKR